MVSNKVEDPGRVEPDVVIDAKPDRNKCPCLGVVHRKINILEEIIYKIRIMCAVHAVQLDEVRMN